MNRIEASMQQELSPARKPYVHLFPFAVSLLLCATLAGCERPVLRQSSTATERPMQPRERSIPDGAIPDRAGEGTAPNASRTPSPPPARDALTDTVITGKIKTAILTDPGMVGADVSVNTDRGVVILAGVVKTPEQTGIASAHAQRQDGVMRVDNHLSIPPT